MNAKRIALGIALSIALLGGAAARADPPAGSTLVATLPVSTPRDVTSGFDSIWVSNGPTGP